MRLKYNLIQLLRTKENLFWGIAFPLVMGIIFFFAFGGVEFELGPIPIALVETRPLNNITRSFVEVVSNLEEEELLQGIHTDYATAAEMLRSGEVAGVVILGNSIELMLMGGGVRQSILETITNEFLIRVTTIANITSLRPELLAQAITAIEHYEPINAPVRELPISAITNFFFVMLAVGCFMGSSMGCKSGFELQAHMTDVAARLSIAPTPKIRLFTENLLSCTIAQSMITIVTLLFYTYVLGVEFGGRWGFILLACIVGSFASVAFGLFFSIVLPGSIDGKSTYLTVISQVLFISAGMISLDVRNIVRSTVPLLDRINIVAIIGDSFLTLVIHEDINRYIELLATLLGIALLCSLAGAYVLRRQAYADL